MEKALGAQGSIAPSGSGLFIGFTQCGSCLVHLGGMECTPCVAAGEVALLYKGLEPWATPGGLGFRTGRWGPARVNDIQDVWNDGVG